MISVAKNIALALFLCDCIFFFSFEERQGLVMLAHLYQLTLLIAPYFQMQALA